MTIVTESHHASVEAMDHHISKELDAFSEKIIKSDKVAKFILTLQCTDRYLDQQGKINTQKVQTQIQYQVLMHRPVLGKITSREGDTIEFQKRRIGKNASEEVILGKNHVTYSAYNKEGVHLGDKVLRCYFHNINYLNQQERLNPRSSFTHKPTVCKGCTEH